MRLRQQAVLVPDESSSAIVAAVADDIAAYLRVNHSAGDTAEGVQQWWLTTTRSHVDVWMVELALESLAARGMVGVRVLASGQRFYGLGDTGGRER